MGEQLHEKDFAKKHELALKRRGITEHCMQEANKLRTAVSSSHKGAGTAIAQAVKELKKYRNLVRDAEEFRPDSHPVFITNLRPERTERLYASSTQLDLLIESARRIADQLKRMSYV